MHFSPQRVASAARARATLSAPSYGYACTSACINARCFSYSATSCASEAETSAAGAAKPNPFPFPAHKPRPTPHEIFHLPRSASAKDIKLRYFELAKLYHPDSAHSRLTDSDQSRWNAISVAYDHLRGKRTSSRSSWPSSSSGRHSPNSHTAYPRAGEYAGRRTPWGGFDPHGGAGPRPHPDGLTEPFWMSQRNIMLAVVGALCGSILMARVLVTSPTVSAAQHHLDAVYNLEQSRRLAKEQGEARRQELRAWVNEGGMRGMGTQIGKGQRAVKPKPPDDALDAREVEAVVSEMEEAR